jgi:hypothetical protein
MLTTKIVKSIITINDDISTVLVIKNINHDIIDRLNLLLSTEFKYYHKNVISNVAIAAPVTSYARTHKMDYIDNEHVLYTDTDSIYTTHKILDPLVGKELGLMKQELDGNIIKEAYFLGIKQYGYYYFDEKK